MHHDPYRVEPRKPLTAKQRLQLFIAHSGTCCLCRLKIGAQEAWIDEHVMPLWLGGSNGIGNRAPAHVECAKHKTAAEATARAKGRRVAEKHFGAKVSHNPIPGSRRSKWKRKINGQVVLR